MKFKNILLSCVFIFGSLSLSGCYTQLSMFYPEPEIEQDEELFYETYSRAAPRVNVGIYAQEGAGQSLGMAYQMMYNRFNGFMGFGNRYNYYNPYGYGGYYNDYITYDVIGGSYTVWIPGMKEKKQRTWTTDRSSTTTTNLNTTRTRTNTNESTNSGGYSNSSNVSVTRGTSSSSSSNSSGRTRATRRN